MNWRKLTTILIVLVVAALIGYDVLTIWQGGVTTSISDVLSTAALTHPVIPLAVGVLCGHLFWNYCPVCARKGKDMKP